MLVGNLFWIVKSNPSMIIPSKSSKPPILIPVKFLTTLLIDSSSIAADINCGVITSPL